MLSAPGVYLTTQSSVTYKQPQTTPTKVTQVCDTYHLQHSCNTLCMYTPLSTFVITYALCDL